MGSETKKYVETVVENNVNLQVKIKNLNETILKQTSNLMTSYMQNIVNKTDISQEFEIKNVDTKGGDFTISGVTIKADAKMKLAALVDTELQADLIEKVQSGLSTQLQESISAKQESSQESGEQFGAIIGDVLKSAMQSVTGSDLDETTKTTIRNELNSYTESITENKINSAVESNINQETINQLAQSLNIDQKFKVKNITTGGGDFMVADVNIEAISSAIIDSMNKNGIGTGMISDITGLTESVVKKSTEVEQTAKKKTQGTIQAFGDAIASAFSGPSGIIVGLVSSVSVAAVVGIVFLQGQSGGSSLGGFKILNFFKNKHNLNLILVALGTIFALNMREKFSKTENIVLKHKTRYMYQNGDKLCLTRDKQLAGKFNIQVIKQQDKDDIVLIKINDKFLRKDGSKLRLVSYETLDKELHDFNFKKLSEISFELFRGDENIIVTKEGCLKLSKKAEPFKIVLE